MMKHGVLFEVNGVKKHSLDDFGLFLNRVEIPFPDIKTAYTEIEGGHGSIDQTEAFGKVFFKDRQFSITFTCKDKIRYDRTLSDLASFLHGREAKVTFYFDEGHYYFGRLSLDKYTSDKGIGTIDLNATFYPFKYRQNVTSVTNQIVNNQSITYMNERMEVTPKFKTNVSMRFEFKGNSYSLEAGETMFPDVEFTEGENVLVWHGNGTVTVSYQEGSI